MCALRECPDPEGRSMEVTRLGYESPERPVEEKERPSSVRTPHCVSLGDRQGETGEGRPPESEVREGILRLN